MAKLKKADRPKVLSHLSEIREGIEDRLAALPADYRAHVETLLDELSDRILAGDYEFAIRAAYLDAMSTLRRMESGEIIGLTSEGGVRTRDPIGSVHATPSASNTVEK